MNDSQWKPQVRIIGAGLCFEITVRAPQIGSHLERHVGYARTERGVRWQLWRAKRKAARLNRRGDRVLKTAKALGVEQRMITFNAVAVGDE